MNFGPTDARGRPGAAPAGSAASLTSGEPRALDGNSRDGDDDDDEYGNDDDYGGADDDHDDDDDDLTHQHAPPGNFPRCFREAPQTVSQQR